VAGLLALFVVTVAATVIDAIGTIELLNRVIVLQHEVCDIHSRVKTWEALTSTRLHIHGPLLARLPDYCPNRPG